MRDFPPALYNLRTSWPGSSWLVPAIHAGKLGITLQVCFWRSRMDGRDKPGHDGFWLRDPKNLRFTPALPFSGRLRLKGEGLRNQACALMISTDLC
jgi:hypothetical protein